jgi:hypothetical protein
MPAQKMPRCGNLVKGGEYCLQKLERTHGNYSISVALEDEHFSHYVRKNFYQACLSDIERWVLPTVTKDGLRKDEGILSWT